jgi:hypothetical protein
MKWTKELAADVRIMAIVLVVIITGLSTYSVLNWIFVKINEPYSGVKTEKYEEKYESPSTNFPKPKPERSKSAGRIETKQTLGRWVHPAIIIIVSVIVVVLFLGVFIVAFISRFF